MHVLYMPKACVYACVCTCVDAEEIPLILSNHVYIAICVCVYMYLCSCTCIIISRVDNRKAGSLYFLIICNIFHTMHMHRLIIIICQELCLKYLNTAIIQSLYNINIHRKLLRYSWKMKMFSPANLSTFTVAICTAVNFVNWKFPRSPLNGRFCELIILLLKIFKNLLDYLSS